MPQSVLDKASVAETCSTKAPPAARPRTSSKFFNSFQIAQR